MLGWSPGGKHSHSQRHKLCCPTEIQGDLKNSYSIYVKVAAKKEYYWHFLLSSMILFRHDKACVDSIVSDSPKNQSLPPLPNLQTT